MKPWQNEQGMTLMELLVCILILSLLVVAMGTGMDTAMKLYGEAQFETDSAMLAGILNTALEDLLADTRNVRVDGEVVRFTSEAYGIQDGSLEIAHGMLGLLRQDSWQLLVNTGIYPHLAVSRVAVRYGPPGEILELTLLDGTRVETHRGGVFYVTYRIESKDDPARCRDVELLVRQLDPK